MQTPTGKIENQNAQCLYAQIYMYILILAECASVPEHRFSDNENNTMHHMQCY